VNRQMEKPQDSLLSVRGLKTYFFTGEGVTKAVDGIDYDIAPGEVLGIVGESGCGKSVSALSILRLVASPPGKIVGGQVIFKGTDLLTVSPDKIRHYRGEQISMIFQDPLTALNPVLTIGTQMAEVFMFHKGWSKKKSWDGSLKMLETVGIPSPEIRISDYPHQLSGGMRQRVMIGMALACEPALLIADEPTTALDVTVQAQILNLIQEMCSRLGTAVLLITHDMGVVAKMCDRVIVMYAGHIMEYADIYTLFNNPQHPYTTGLLASLPSLGAKKRRLQSIEGVPPRLNRLLPGCPFFPRCKEADEPCTISIPRMVSLHDDHKVRCIKRG
jgi:oligopeptide/dipeptide ABC transporter ATP-binding protein